MREMREGKREKERKERKGVFGVIFCDGFFNIRKKKERGNFFPFIYLTFFPPNCTNEETEKSFFDLNWKKKRLPFNILKIDKKKKEKRNGRRRRRKNRADP